MHFAFSRIAALVVFVFCVLYAGMTDAQTPANPSPPTREAPADVHPGRDLVLPALPESFRTEQRGAVTWSYPARAQTEARALMQAYQTAWPRIVDEFGADIDPTLTVRIAKNPDEMARVAPINAPPPAYASGVAYPDAGFVLLTLATPETWEMPNLEVVFAHELSHIALHRAVDGHPVPRWFTEGVAIQQSGENSFDRTRTLWEANVAGNLIPMRALSRSFPSRPHEVNIAYAQAASFVAFLHDDTDHADRVPRLLRELKRGRDFSTATFEAFNRSLGTLEREWRKELNERYTAWPLLLSGSGLWVLTSVLIVLAAMRSRRRKRATLARWGEEEAEVDRIRLEARERQLKRLRDAEAAQAAQQPAPEPVAQLVPAVRVHAVRRPVAPEPPDYLVPMPLAEPREAEVPTVRHEGRDHTLH